MTIPPRLIVAGAVVIAIPCGWMLGVLAAEAIVGRDVGALPVLTIPLGIIGSITFALVRIAAPATRLVILATAFIAAALLA